MYMQRSHESRAQGGPLHNEGSQKAAWLECSIKHIKFTDLGGGGGGGGGGAVESAVAPPFFMSHSICTIYLLYTTKHNYLYTCCGRASEQTHKVSCVIPMTWIKSAARTLNRIKCVRCPRTVL